MNLEKPKKNGILSTLVRLMISKVNPIQNLQKMMLFMKLGADFIISNWVFLNFKKKASPEKMTLPETNSKFAPENGWLDYWVSFWDLAHFQGRTCC